MKKQLKSILTCLALCSLFSISSALASEQSNWTETFQLKGGNWIMHTPDYMILDGSMRIGRSINMAVGSTFNDIEITGCGLHVKTESTREEFVAALTCSNLYTP